MDIDPDKKNGIETNTTHLNIYQGYQMLIQFIYQCRLVSVFLCETLRLSDFVARKY